MTEKEFLDRYDRGDKFTDSGDDTFDSECEKLAFGEYGFEIVDEIEGETSRWTRTMTTIFKAGERHFAIDWEKGLTEMQEHFFWDQPYEVVKKKKRITVTKWEPIKDGDEE